MINADGWLASAGTTHHISFELIFVPDLLLHRLGVCIRIDIVWLVERCH
jgi:hypothetical protein